MALLINGLGWFISKVSRSMPVETDFTLPMQGSWYLSPSQHGFELIGFTIFFYLLFLFSIKYLCRPGSPEWKLLAMYDNTTEVTLFRTGY